MASVSSGAFQVARVIDVVRETATTVTVLFGTDLPLQYRPGQYVQVEFRFGSSRYRRPYSLSSRPGDDHHAITVRHLPGGKVSSYITGQLAIGDPFRVSAARGDFLLPDSRAARRFVFVAGGVGIAPVLPMIRTLLAMPSPPPVSLLYYSRNVDDIVFGEPLAGLADAHAGFDYQPVVTGPRSGWHGLHEPFSCERVLAAAAGDPLTLFYVCGPDAMNGAAVTGLQAAGIPAGQIMVEHFSAATSPERPDRGFPVTFQRKGLLFTRRRRAMTRPGETLLAAAERVGLGTPSDCRQGTCGRCRATLLRGEVVMDEPNSLTVADARAGRILTCVARAASPVIVEWRN